MTTTNPKHNNSWGVAAGMPGTTPRKQLQLFYARQGLTHDEARKAIRHDLRRIRKENKGTYQGKDTLTLGISGLLLMGLTKEGMTYWIDRQISWPERPKPFCYPRVDTPSPFPVPYPSALEFLH